MQNRKIFGEGHCSSPDLPPPPEPSSSREGTPSPHPIASAPTAPRPRHLVLITSIFFPGILGHASATITSLTLSLT